MNNRDDLLLSIIFSRCNRYTGFSYSALKVSNSYKLHVFNCRLQQATSSAFSFGFLHCQSCPCTVWPNFTKIGLQFNKPIYVEKRFKNEKPKERVLENRGVNRREIAEELNISWFGYEARTKIPGSFAKTTCSRSHKKMLDNAANDPTFIKHMKREFTNTTSKLFNNLTKGAAKLSRNQNKSS